MWERLVGQETAVRALREAVATGTSSHAYLFAGPDGVGRVLAALALAASLNCDEAGCGTCDVCTKVLRRAHPDVWITEAEGAQILVEQVREVRQAAHRSAMQGRAKVFIFEDAHKLNLSAANALLKVLEEPPAGVVFVLITGAPEDLPETVVSRCRRIDFSPMGLHAIERVLIDHHDADAETAAWAARTGGDVARALRFVKDPEAPARRDAHLSIAGRLVRGGIAEAITAAAELSREAAAAAAGMAAQHKEELARFAEMSGEARGSGAARKRLEDRHKRELRRRETEAYDSALRDAASFYRDVLVAGAGGGTESLVNREWDERIARASAVADPAWLVAALDRIEEVRRAVGRSAQPALALEALFMELATPRARATAAAGS
jgi:DNA polymerase-3 subunit delta'